MPPSETSSPSASSARSASDVEELVLCGARAYSPVPVDPAAMIPDLFTHPPLVRDRLQTDTSDIQDDTVQLCLPFMASGSSSSSTPSAAPRRCNAFGVPGLDRPRHVKFLRNNLQTLPGGFVGYDASRPWLLYWCLNGLALLGEDVSSYRAALIRTARSMQNPTGGFGGGHGQKSHLATTYATVLALAIVGGDACYEAIDRRSMCSWLSALKQPSGGFQMSVGAEVDVRGAYCAAVIVSILRLPLALSSDSPAWTSGATLFTGLGEYVQRCQTYEGGISAQPGSEAHGGYAFCALGCLSILDSPDRSFPRYLHVPRLVSWLSARQYAPEGGFSGRTNKLVDGCYSHWVGDCWPLVEACLGRSKSSASLFSREGLIRYILCCCQDQTKRGGLRDKPGRMSDPYHTCYVLAGLSSAQHQWELVRLVAEEEPRESAETAAMPADSTWVVSPFVGDSAQVFDEQDRVSTLHPVYTIPAERVAQMKSYFAAKEDF